MKKSQNFGKTGTGIVDFEGQMDEILEEVDGAHTIESATHRGERKLTNKKSSIAIRKMTSKDGRLNP